MSKLGCVCGHTIVDQTDNISYKAMFIRDQDREIYWQYSDDIASFIDAIESGQREVWIRKYFSDSYPTDIKNASVIFDIVSRHERDLIGEIFQCEKCGRIKVEVQNTKVFSSFMPEDNRCDDLFKGITLRENGA